MAGQRSSLAREEHRQSPLLAELRCAPTRDTPPLPDRDVPPATRRPGITASARSNAERPAAPVSDHSTQPKPIGPQAPSTASPPARTRSSTRHWALGWTSHPSVTPAIEDV